MLTTCDDINMKQQNLEFDRKWGTVAYNEVIEATPDRCFIQGMKQSVKKGAKHVVRETKAIQTRLRMASMTEIFIHWPATFVHTSVGVTRSYYYVYVYPQDF